MTTSPAATTLDESSLFGIDGRERNREQWLDWVRQTDPDGAAAAIDRLAQEGCDRNRLMDYLMELHAIKDWKPVSRRQAEKALGHVKRAATSVRMLADSDLRYFLGEKPPGEREGLLHLPDLAGKLEDLAQSLQKVKEETTGRESLGRNVLLLHLIRFVGWATGFCRDDELDTILQTVFHDERWSTERWRRDHKSLFRKQLVKRLEAKWNEQVVKRELQPPSKVRKRRQPNGYRVGR
jgi:hypothetical protein